MLFGDKLAQAVLSKKNPVCVGLDPRWEQLPPCFHSASSPTLADKAMAYAEFSKAIIDIVAPLVPCVKPQAAFFEELGPAGMVALHQVIQHARSQQLLVILDGKRNDIGSTAEAYASAYLGGSDPQGWQADALTVSPYLGDDTLVPFVSRCYQTDTGIFVLVKTSNPGSAFLQDRVADGLTTSLRVAAWVEQESYRYRGTFGFGSIGAVVGATYPEELTLLREKMPSTWFLIPGYGAQGGTAQDVRRGLNSQGLGAIVNSSRGIIFAHTKEPNNPHWESHVEKATLAMIADLQGA